MVIALVLLFFWIFFIAILSFLSFWGGRGFNMKLKTDFLFSVQNFVGCFIVLFLETVTLMCFSVSQLFVYRNSTDICVNFISHHFSESVDQLQGFSGEIFSVCICVYAYIYMCMPYIQQKVYFDTFSSYLYALDFLQLFQCS